MKKYKALKNHICGNNDGECVCKCFNKGYKKAVKDIKKIIDDMFFESERDNVYCSIDGLLGKKKDISVGYRIIKSDGISVSGTLFKIKQK